MTQCESLGISCYPSGKVVPITSNSWDITWEFPGCWNVLLAKIDCMTHYHVCLWQIISRGDNRDWTVGRYFPVLSTVHWKYIVVIDVVENHLTNSSVTNCSLLSSCFSQSCSACPSHCCQRYKVHRGCGTVHVQMHCCSETKSKVYVKIIHPARFKIKVTLCHTYIIVAARDVPHPL